MIFPIVKNNVYELTIPCEEWDFANSPLDSHEFAKDLIATMYDAAGVGLSANQCGFRYRVFVMKGSPADFACFNPRIVSYSKEQVVYEEGCLSFPNVVVKVKRPSSIRVRFADYNGEVSTHDFIGLTARVFQHEMDHIEGKLFYNRVSRYHREKALKDAILRNKQIARSKE